MSLLDLFRAKPKVCTACGNPTPGLHHVYPGLRGGEETERLCTRCLLAQLGQKIQGKTILFVEPITSDGYCYAPPGEVGHLGLTQERVGMALGALGSKCAVCTSKPQHLWMPLNDLDETAMEKQARTDYWSIPTEPSKWKETLNRSLELSSFAVEAFHPIRSVSRNRAVIGFSS
jgi:hypothetical protein